MIDYNKQYSHWFVNSSPASYLIRMKAFHLWTLLHIISLVGWSVHQLVMHYNFFAQFCI